MKRKVEKTTTFKELFGDLMYSKFIRCSMRFMLGFKTALLSSNVDLDWDKLGSE